MVLIQKLPEMFREFYVLHLELAHELVVRFCVFALQVLHLAAAFANLFDETAT